MHIETMILSNESELIKKYKKHDMNIMKYFDYMPYSTYEKRLADLSERQFNRKDLVKVLQHLNRDWHAPTQTMENIERLKDENSVVVIGGQQAGLLTGPLYTIHKIISIIKYAKEQEEKLNIPVIPVFWIAGEDHDYDEINHIFTASNGEINKRIIAQEEWQKRSITNITLNKTVTHRWIKEVFHDLVETEYTKELVEMILSHVEQSETFVDFFARLVFQLFGDEGIVLIDSADENLRHLESDLFAQLIKRQEQITEAIFNTSQKVNYEGYNVQVDVTADDANLFYHDDY